MSKKGFNYTLQIDAEINDLIAKTNQVRKSMQTIMDLGKAPGAEKIFSGIEKAIERLQTKASQPIESVAAFESLQKEATAVSTSLSNLGVTIEKLSSLGVADKLDLLPPNLKQQIEEAEKALANFANATAKAAEKTEELVSADNALTTAKKELQKAEGRVSEKKALIEAQKQLVKDAHAEADAIKDKIEALKKYQATYAAYEAAGGDKRKAGGGKAELEGLNLPADRKAAQSAIPGLDLKDAIAVETAIARLNEEYRQAGKTITDVETTQRRYTVQLNEAQNAVTVTSSKVKTLSERVEQLNTEFEASKAKNTQAAYTQLRNEAGKLGVELSNIPIEYTEENFAKLNEAMMSLVTEGIAQVNANINSIQVQMEETGTSAQNLGDRMSIAKEEVIKFDATVANTTAFVERIKQFVGLAGGIEIARAAMRNAFSTIKELDAAMTEMAVVTDLEVGDYWKQLPDHTKRASELGVAIHSVYEAETLYYQQGLKTVEAQELANTTLRMARIAGLDAAEATDKMTAALRGFNMELNEASAEKVADVYSELAAITAADVNEISSAMTKTASIAASAGMEFETTAAFLSQIIETTRESAETAGTAMKTVIARFSEVKKLQGEGLLTGSDEEGEVIDVNKIQTALRSVGISMNEFFAGTEGLDSIFLKLAEKWDTLDVKTQRYIATTAAGSRQQSRFIAMMSDYARTQELVEAANSSAGASQKQYEKTLESLESKLNELKNAWDRFTMGITDSEILKKGIDLLTGILNVINNITDAFGNFSGAAKIGILVGALYLGDKALKVFMNSVKGSATVFQAFGATGRAAVDSIRARFLTLKKLFTSKLNIKIGSEQLYKATQATKAHSQATRELQSIETQRAAAAKAGTLTDAQAAMYSQQAAEATAMQSAAEKELMATMGLSVTQLEAVSALEALNITTGDALILTKAGISAATLAEISAINGKTAAENASILAQNLSNASGIKAISAKIGLTVANWAQTASENAKTGSLWASVTATIAQTMANWGLQASMWPILVVGLLLVAALGALVLIIYGIVKAVQAWKANQPEAQLAALEEKAEAAKETAKETKEVYDQLLTSRDEYEGMVDTLDDLTEGTIAWKEAVSELNAKVLELIAAYPQLTQFLQIAENGVMTIDSAGWDKVIKEQEGRVARSQQIAAQRQADTVEQRKSMNGFEKKTVQQTSYYDKNGNPISAQQAFAGASSNSRGPTNGSYARTVSVTKLDYDVGTENQAALEELSQLTWGTQEYNVAMAELRKSIGSTNTEQLAALESFDATAKTLAELTKEEEMYEQQALRMAGSFEARADASHERIVASLADSYDAMDQAVQAQADEKWKNKGGMWTNGNDGTNDDLLLELGKYGLTSRGSEKADMAQLLAAKGGHQYTADEIEDMGKGADNQLAKELAEIDAAEAIGDNYVDKLYQLQEENAQLGELYSGSLDIDLKAIQTEVDAIKTADGILEEALNNRIETVKQGQKDVDLELQKIYNNSGIDAKQFAGSYDQAKQFINTYNEMLSGVGAGLAISFADMFQNFDPSQQEAFFDQYGDVNWSSSIDGAAALKEMLQSDSVAMQEFAAKTLALENKMYSATAQMNEFYKTLDSEALKDLATDGQITATEMLELAKTNEKLATMMDNTGVSAADLGNYYELLTEGTISAYEATGNFIKALSELNAASNAIEDAFGFIDTFEPSRSQTEISEYFADMRESAMELYDLGAYGDQQLKDYIEAFLGESNWQAIIDKNNGDMKDAIDEAMAQINSYGENLYGTWQTLIEQGLQGVFMGEDGSIQFDMSQIGSVEDLKQQILNMGWSEAMADALVADAQTFSANLQDNLDQLGIQNSFETWLSEAFSINGKTIIPKGQVKAMAKELGVTFEQLKKDLEGQGISVGDWITEDGKIGEDFKDLREEMIKTAKEAGEFDLDTNYQLLLELGLDDDEAKKQLKDMAGSLTNVPFVMNGQTVKDASGVIYDSTGVAIEGGTTGGLIDGLEDPKVKAAQDLSAIEQGEMMAKANATGSIVASRIALQTTAEGIDKLINGAIDILNLIPGVKISKSNLAASVAGNTEQLVNSATSQIESRNKTTKEALNKTINANTTGANTSSAIANLANKYAQKSEDVISSYITGNAQTKAEEAEMWENPYNELYNLNQKLNTAIRTREKLERAYEKAVEDSSKTAQELANITAAELSQLKEEADIQKDIAKEAAANAAAKQAENPNYSDLYSFDAATGEIQVDWEKVNLKGWGEDEGAAFEDFIAYLEEQGDTIRNAQDALEEVQDSVEEIEKRGRDATSSIYNQVKEGLVKQYESELDALEALNNSIQEASEAMLTKMQEQIDDARQARDNEKAENEIADKEARLAYLMRDSSGGNAVEIAELQKEIEEDKQSHTDSLVDQAIDKLSKENERAAEQREKQLEIQRAQLEAYVNSTAIWNDVKQLVDAGFAAVANGTEFKNTTAGQLAASGADVNTLNPFEKEDFYTELERSAKEGAIHEGFVGIQGNGSVTSISSLADSINDTVGGLEMNVTTTATGAVVTTTVPAYKAGGLANFTGPAWLDGTKSKPEIVLNQQDSANFIQLRDILADILNGTSSSGERKESKSGDNYFDIAINVENISDDYDIEQLANKIRSMLYEDATYRNVNAINLIR